MGTFTNLTATPVAVCKGVRCSAAGPPSASSASTVVSQSTVAECASIRRSACFSMSELPIATARALT
jgi:hypothetical protein